MPKPYKLSPEVERAYETLKQVRASTSVSLKPIDRLKKEVVGFDGKLQEFKLRYYQVQGAFHMIRMKRLVLGDDAGLGKTVETIAALSYLWEKEHQNKVLVVAPKSAVHQWASEIRRFTNDVRPIVVETPKSSKSGGALEARKKAYKEWLDAPTGPNAPKVVLILNYALLIRDWNAEGYQPLKPNGRPDPKQPVLPGVLDGITQKVADTGGLVVVSDECFDYHTPITLADGSTELIGKIVCSGKPVEVLSWNFKSRRLENRPVIRGIRNPLERESRRINPSLVKVEFKFARSCRVTKSHSFFRVNGQRRRAIDLKVGDDTAYLNMCAPSNDQLQVVLGSLLGDASISFPERSNWGVSFVQGAKQESYLEFKREVLKTLGVSKVDTAFSGYESKVPLYRFRLNSNPSFCSKYSPPNGKKVVNREWLESIGPLGLAVWYGDDGSIQTHRTKKGFPRYNITLHTQGFSEGENELLAGWLWWKWGVEAHVKRTNKGHFYIYLPHGGAANFLRLLPGALPGVEYKFPGLPTLSPEDLNTTPTQELIEDRVRAISSWGRAPKKRPCQQFVYDLEVEGNHNYFAGGTLVSNCTAFKSKKTKTWETCYYLSARAQRSYGLTATLLKNNLMEGFAIYGVIRPGLFTTQSAFFEDYCYVEMKKAGRKQFPLVKGYKNLEHFRERIDPFFLGRKKHNVSNELPVLTTREVVCELSRMEDLKYEEALSGVLELGDGEIKDFEEHKALVSLGYCQQVANSMHLLKFQEGGSPTGRSSKEQGLVDLLTGELDDEKVIVYTRFASHVDRLQLILKKEGIQSVRITGKEKDTERRKNQKAFQDLKSKVKVVFITAAGTEAINLQAAAAMIFFDLPWSWGDYVQAIGRMVRIGSPHKGVLAFHLMAKRPVTDTGKTIDHHVLSLLRKKKSFIDKILGESAKGTLRFDKDGTTLQQLVKSMQGKGERSALERVSEGGVLHADRKPI